MWAELAVASWETVWHRTVLMISGECTTEEYQRMMDEKLGALHQAGVALATLGDAEDVLRPFHGRATANALRLRGA